VKPLFSRFRTVNDSFDALIDENLCSPKPTFDCVSRSDTDKIRRPWVQCLYHVTIFSEQVATYCYIDKKLHVCRKNSVLQIRDE
jgi:hypothetical protein